MNTSDPIRYPVGWANRHKCLCALSEDNLDEPLDYIQSRKKIYVPLFCRLVKEESQFKELKQRLCDGENLLIIEVDGPHEESLHHYISNYGVDSTFIEKDTMIVDKDHLKIMLNDSKHPFGHGYCLGASLLGIDDEILE
jgi:hypothetical protein